MKHPALGVHRLLLESPQLKIEVRPKRPPTSLCGAHVTFAYDENGFEPIIDDSLALPSTALRFHLERLLRSLLTSNPFLVLREVPLSVEEAEMFHRMCIANITDTSSEQSTTRSFATACAYALLLFKKMRISSLSSDAEIEISASSSLPST